MLEHVTLEHVPSTHGVHIALYRDVKNAQFLQEQLLSRNQDFEYAFIDASTLVSRFHLLAAVFKGIQLEIAGQMRTPNVHSEIVCALSGNNNIAEAYRRYGVQPSTRDLIAVKVLISRDASSESAVASSSILTPEVVEKFLDANVEGQNVPCSDEELAKITDWAKLRKYHKLNGAPGLEAIKDEEARRKECEMLIVSAMALRGL